MRSSKVSIIIGLIVIVVIAGGAFFIFSDAEDKKKPAVTDECAYTQDEMDQVLAMFARDIAEEPLAVDADAVAALEGECELDALEKAYELGGRTLRDLSDCWDECSVTLDYSEQRINFAAENNRMIYIANG